MSLNRDHAESKGETGSGGGGGSWTRTTVALDERSWDGADARRGIRGRRLRLARGIQAATGYGRRRHAWMRPLPHWPDILTFCKHAIMKKIFSFLISHIIREMVYVENL